MHANIRKFIFIFASKRVPTSFENVHRIEYSAIKVHKHTYVRFLGERYFRV